MLPVLEKLFRRKPVASSARAQFDEFYALARSAVQSRDLNRAILLYDKALQIDPAHAEALYKRGNALRHLGQLEAAIASYDQAIELRPDYAHAFCNRGVVQQSLGQRSAALSSYDRAIALDSTDAMAHYNRALLLQDLCRWDEVLASYNRAIQADPHFADAQYNRSLALLLQGDFATGLPAYEWRWKNAQRLGLGAPRQFTQSLWLGTEPIAGKRLLLHCEGGFGDSLQFCRYAASCAALGATVLLEVPPPLRALMESLAGVAQLLVAGDALPPFDYHCPLMSLPFALGTRLDTIPAAPKYLQPDPAKVESWRRRLGQRSRPRVGLAWSGNPNNPVDSRRSFMFADWVAHLPQDFQYFCLQRDIRDADREALASHPSILSFSDDLVDFSVTAALCECMDVVVSVDTSVAHLAGAVGRPTWVMLPVNPDWRWLQERTDSPWYPTARLYRQATMGDWDEVFARIAGDLQQLRT